MKRIDVWAVAEWDDLELLNADAGKVFSEPSDANWADYWCLNNRVPEIETVEVVSGPDSFSVAPASGQVRNQLAYGTLYRKARYLGWKVSNLSKRFDPFLAANLARRYGSRRLRYRSSWFKIIVPECLIIKGEQQRHRDSVRYMIEALSRQEPVMALRTFWELSARSIARAMPANEAQQYLEEGMGVR